MVGENMTFKEEIEKILMTLLKVLEELRTSSLEKTETIIANNIEKIQEITKKEEKLAGMIAELERQRQEIFHTWGIDKDTPISSIAEKLPEGGKDLIGMREDMLKLIEEINIRNDLNKDLIEENLDWIDFNMNLITSLDSNPSYKDEDKKSINIFDRKV